MCIILLITERLFYGVGLPPLPPIWLGFDFFKFSPSLPGQHFHRENGVDAYFRLSLILKITLILIFAGEKRFA
jgi:hypothetical protein